MKTEGPLLTSCCFVVGFGLLAAAQEKMQSLDSASAFLAILVLGYTASVVKNLITKT